MMFFTVFCSAFMATPVIGFQLYIQPTVATGARMIHYDHLHQHQSPVSLSSTQLLVSLTTTEGKEDDDDEYDDECSISSNSGPATVFGKPISAEIKEWNSGFIKVCKSFLFDKIFQGTGFSRYYARFYALENIARMPYFSYVSVLHLYESLGWWRKAEYLKVHFSESWNEQHHLLIMEELGGSNLWKDRFVAQHIAFFYYWIVIALYMHNPTLAYNLNQAVEEEAYQTYNNFIQANKEILQQKPAPQAAKKYYTGNDLYMFDAMHFDEQGSREVRRPTMNTLYDAFVAVRDDEAEHVKTMAYLQDDSCR